MGGQEGNRVNYIRNGCRMREGGILLAFLPIIYLSEIIHHWLVLSGDGGKGGELRGYARK